MLTVVPIPTSTDHASVDAVYRASLTADVDGRRFAFVDIGTDAPNTAIHIDPTTDGQPNVVTGSGGIDVNAKLAFSPDGSRLLIFGAAPISGYGSSPPPLVSYAIAEVVDRVDVSTGSTTQLAPDGDVDAVLQP